MSEPGIRRFLFLIISLLSLAGMSQSGFRPPEGGDPLRQLQQLRSQQQQIRESMLKMADSLGLPVRIELEDGRIMELQYFEQGHPMYNITANSSGAVMIKTNEVYTGGVSGLNLSGAGQFLGIWDEDAVRESHVELTGRVEQIDRAASLSNHATHVAGTLIASGVDPEAKGMSYQARLWAHDWNNAEVQMLAASFDRMQVSQHSYVIASGWIFSSGSWYWYGHPDHTEDWKYGFYSSGAQLWDWLSQVGPRHLIVKSAGNDRGKGPAPGTTHFVRINGEWVSSTMTREINGGEDGFDCIPPRGNAKNVLTVGNVDQNQQIVASSSWGPTDDGRIKPDIVAKGSGIFSSWATGDEIYASIGGTSMSGPMISGSIGLLHEHRENLQAGMPLLSSTTKALVIHTADDMVSGSAGPDYRYGWGLMNTQKAAEIITAQATQGHHIFEAYLQEGQILQLPITASGDSPLRITLAWIDPYGPTPEISINPTLPALVNDLDIRVTRVADNVVYQPYILDPANPANPATTGDNFRDNLEMIHLASPSRGSTYMLSISHKNLLQGPSQSFSLIISGHQLPASPARPENLTAQFTSAESIQISWQKAADATETLIVYSPDNIHGWPEDFQTYAIGQTLPGGGRVIYRGSGESVQHQPDTYNPAQFYTAFSIDDQGRFSPGKSTRAAASCAHIDGFPFAEHFGENSLSRQCWTQESPGGTASWTFSTGAPTGPISTAYSGIRNARLEVANGSKSATARLISPWFDIAQLEQPRLSFRYAQPANLSNSNSLTVLYRQSQEAEWTSWASLTGDVSAWTSWSAALPEAVKNEAPLQLAFEATDLDGHASVIDHIELRDCRQQNLPYEEVSLLSPPADLPACWIAEESSNERWLITPGFDLIKGVVYELSFTIRAPGAEPSSFTMHMSDRPEPGTMTQITSSMSLSSNWLSLTLSFTPSRSGVHYIAWLTQNQYPELNYTHLDVAPGIYWLGEINNDWNNAGNWSHDISKQGRSISITDAAHSPLLAENITLAGLSIHHNASVSLSPSAELSLMGELQNHSGPQGLWLKSDASGTASLIHDTPGVQAYIERYIPQPSGLDGSWDDGFGWRLLSAPTARQPISPTFTTSSPDDYDFYLWHEPLATWINFKGPDWNTRNLGPQGSPAQQQFAPGRGYLVAYRNEQENMAFSGAVHTEDIHWQNLSVTEAGNPDPATQGWHLLGNPFASALDWDHPDWALQDIAHTAKIWDEQARAYVDIHKNPTEGLPHIIPAAQGFFVQALDAVNQITIPASARVHATQSWYKTTPAAEGIFLTARQADQPKGQAFTVLFDPGAEDAFNSLLDSRFLPGYAPRLYGQFGEEKASSKRLPPAEHTRSLALGFAHDKTGEMIIKLNSAQLPHNMQLWLIDHQRGLNHPLSQQPQYAFMHQTGNPASRFSLVIGYEESLSQETITESPSGGLRAWYHGQGLYTQNPHDHNQVEVFDLHGRLLHRYQTSESLHRETLRLSPGVYLLRSQPLPESPGSIDQGHQGFSPWQSQKLLVW